jgi:hypothetical protein
MNTPFVAAGTGSAEPPVWAPGLEQDAADEAPEIEVVTAPISRSTARNRPRRANSTSALLVVAALVAFGGVGFAVGHATASGQAAASTQNGNAAAGQFGPNASGPPDGGLRGGFGAATVTGTVISVATDSITVKLASGQTVTVATGSSTTYHNQTAGSSTDLAAGQTVQVQTSNGTNPDANASASPGTQTTRTATEVTITSK